MRWSASLEPRERAFGSSSNLRPLGEARRAAHLLGDLKDPRGVDVLIPLLSDGEVGAIVPWSLAEIGDRRAIEPLIRQLERDDPSVRVLAIFALERLNAHEALPALRELLQDHRTSRLGDPVAVSEAARRAIAIIGR